MVGERTESRMAWRISLVFLALGLLWTALTSSGWTDRVTGGTRSFSPVHAATDILFVLLAAALLHGLVRTGYRRTRLAEKEALQSGADRYRDLFESATDILFTHDFEGRLTTLNRAGEVALGLTREQAVGLTLDRIIAPEDLEVAQALIGRARRGGGTVRAELHLLARDGSRIPVEVSSHTIDHDGRPYGILCSARDRRQRQELEAQLQQSQKMEAIGRLAAGVAHDLNNALTAIAGYAGLSLARLRQEDPGRGDLQGVLRATDRASAMTRQLLSLSRRQVVVPRVLDLNVVLVDLAPMFPRLVGEDIELVIEPQAQPATVLADLGQIEQIIMNLCVNARDAMPHGGRLRLATANADWGTPVAPGPAGPASDAYVVLLVQDNGTGMNAETKARVFEPFFSTREPGTHSGLGLSTVYGIVRQNHGAITFDTAPGKGTTFRVLFPLVVADETVTPASATDMPRAGRETILLVEDDELVRELARRFLERYRYVVLEAADAASALALSDAHAGAIDLLLTDVVMPRMSGPNLARELQARRPGVRVVYVSGYADFALAPLGMSDAVLHKPFSELDLMRKVRQALDAVAGAPAAEHGAAPAHAEPHGPVSVRTTAPSPGTAAALPPAPPAGPGRASPPAERGRDSSASSSRPAPPAATGRGGARIP
ncbi:MAG TPA: PAS domain S-box protein [Planctomycetota bacterium]|nr:PAS domain S-box protein [Planctomycetota bacterium]